MGLPKNYRKNVDITPDKEGYARRKKLIGDISNDGTYLPKGILHEDMDSEFINFVKNEVDLTLGGERVPVIFLSSQRWGEFTKTWEYTDIDKNIKIPFITIVRKPDAQPGTNYSTFLNVPGKPLYSYMKIPTWDGNRSGYDLYKIPQPVSIDILYEVRIFCNRMRDLNKMNLKMLKMFSSLQKYIFVNDHPIPLVLDSTGDESVITNVDERKYYVQLYTIKMMGYLLDEDDFIVTPSISRVVNFYEISEELYRASYQVNLVDFNNNICINIMFQSSVFSVTIPIEIDATYTTINSTNSDSVILKVNGSTVTIPFTVHNGDELYIKVNKTDVTDSSGVEINGTTI
jgi:hypothetical protein